MFEDKEYKARKHKYIRVNLLRDKFFLEKSNKRKVTKLFLNRNR